MLKCSTKTLSAPTSNYSEVKIKIYICNAAVRIYSLDWFLAFVTLNSLVMDSKVFPWRILLTYITYNLHLTDKYTFSHGQKRFKISV